MSFKTSTDSGPSVSVSYGTINAGIFLQVNYDAEYVSFDRAGEIVANMPDSARNILLAPIQNGLIDVQSVFYLIDDSNEGGQVAIFVEDFVELASNGLKQPVINEELPLENGAQKTEEPIIIRHDAENCSTSGQQLQITSSDRYMTMRQAAADETTVVPPRLLDALFRKSSNKVQPSITCEQPTSRFGSTLPPSRTPSQLKDEDENGYIICKPPSNWLICQCWDRIDTCHRSFIVAGVVFLIALAAAGGLVTWIALISPSEIPRATEPSKIQTTTEYQPPQNHTARCLKALCLLSTDCDAATAVNYTRDGFARGCRKDGGSEACGWYLIHQLYFQDCMERDPGIMKDWRLCALDYDCSTSCVTQYFRRYERGCPVKMDRCECLIRNHVGGPTGHKKNETLANWKKIEAILEKQ